MAQPPSDTISCSSALLSTQHEAQQLSLTPAVSQKSAPCMLARSAQLLPGISDAATASSSTHGSGGGMAGMGGGSGGSGGYGLSVKPASAQVEQHHGFAPEARSVIATHESVSSKQLVYCPWDTTVTATLLSSQMSASGCGHTILHSAMPAAVSPSQSQPGHSLHGMQLGLLSSLVQNRSKSVSTGQGLLALQPATLAAARQVAQHRLQTPGVVHSSRRSAQVPQAPFGVRVMWGNLPLSNQSEAYGSWSTQFFARVPAMIRSYHSPESSGKHSLRGQRSFWRDRRRPWDASLGAGDVGPPTEPAMAWPMGAITMFATSR